MNSNQNAEERPGSTRGFFSSARLQSLVKYLLLGLTASAAQASPIKKDEEVVFFPSVAQESTAEPGGWVLEIQGLIFEPEKPPRALSLLRRALEVEGQPLTPAEQRLFHQRTRTFFADHEGRKRISIQLGSEVFKLDASANNGHFVGKLRISEKELMRLRGPGTNLSPWVRFNAVTRSGDERIFSGAALCLEETGLSIISDIDDTIKFSEVTDKRALIRNTFFEEFKAIKEMPALYQDWERQYQAQFHYVSASPWQLFDPLEHFVATQGFPAGTFHMRHFRWKDKSLLAFFRSPEGYKTEVLEPLIKRFPKRRFVLVGDSGEFDPEIYGSLARKFPEQIWRIYIRRVGKEERGPLRYHEAFKGVPEERWKVFDSPSEVARERLLP